MKWQTTLALFVIAVAVTAWVQYLEGDRFTRKVLNQPIRDAVASFHTVDIRNGRERFLMEYEDERWMLREPMAFPAQPSTVDWLVQHLRQTKVRGEGDPDRRAEYGLDNPSLEVRMAGTREYVWRFGDLHPDQPLVYVELIGGESSPVILCDRGLRDGVLAQAKLATLRSDALFGISWLDTGEVLVEHGGTRARMVLDDRMWRLVEPRDGEADLAEMRVLVGVLNSWTILEFEADGPGIDFAKYGLDRPRAAVTITETAGGRAVKLEVGGDAPPGPGDQARVYVRRAGEPHVFVAAREALETIERAPDTYRSRALVSLPEPEVQSVVIRNPRVLQRYLTSELTQGRSGDWQLRVGQQTYPVRPGIQGVVVDALRSGGIERFVEDFDAGNLQRYGFDDPVSVTVTPESGGGGKQEVLVGKQTDDGLHYVWNTTRWGKDYCAVADLYGAREVLRAPYSLRAPQVLDITALDVLRLSVETRAGTSVTFARTQTQWFIEQDRSLSADVGILSIVMRVLRAQMRIQSWERSPDGAPDRGDFDVHLTVEVPGQPSRTRHFYLGPVTGNHRIIRDGAEGWLFRVATSTRGDVFDKLAEYVDSLPIGVEAPPKEE